MQIHAYQSVVIGLPGGIQQILVQADKIQINNNHVLIDDDQPVRNKSNGRFVSKPKVTRFCTVPGCNKISCGDNKSFCRRHNDLRLEEIRNNNPNIPRCSIMDCANAMSVKSYCDIHYWRSHSQKFITPQQIEQAKQQREQDLKEFFRETARKLRGWH